MQKDLEAKIVTDILRSLNFSAEKIPECPQDGKRADILAKKEGDHFLIEVKSKSDHPSLKSEIDNANDFEIIQYQKGLYRSNTLSGIVRDAVTQLSNTPDSHNSFKIMWFRAVESIIEDEMLFLKTTLYGKRHLLVKENDGRISHASCYYFDINEFYKYPSLDGVILDNGKGLELCVNDFAQKVQEFRESSVYSVFDKHHAVTDPSKLEAKKEILIADTPMPRNDEDAIKAYIENKYNINVQIFNLNSMGGVIVYSD
jgi:hypothetical protein